MTIEIAVESVEEFDRACMELAAQHPGSQIYFRGQVHNYPPSPSEARPSQDANEEVWRAHARDAWNSAVLGLLVDELGVGPATQESGMCLLQHYGFRSWFIDITDDAKIALWFAQNVYRETGDFFLRSHDEHDEHPVPLWSLTMAHYEPTIDPGYVYVYSIPKGSTSLLDLQSVAPLSALRVRRQRAAGLLAVDGHDPADYQLARIKVRPSLGSLVGNGGEALGAEYLFPGPNEDTLYRHLLRVPRIDAGAGRDGFRHVYDPLRIPLYKTPGLLAYLPVMAARTTTMYATPCLTCLGMTATTIELPFTGAGGPQGRYFTPTSQRRGLPERSRSEVDEMSALWPPSPRFLRVPLLRELSMGLMASDELFPIFRGYHVSDCDSKIEVRLIYEVDSSVLSMYPPPQEPGYVFDLPIDVTEVPDGSECQGSDNAGRCAHCEAVDRMAHGFWLRTYYECLASGDAELWQTSPHHFGYYWRGPEAAAPIGTLWRPDVAPIDGTTRRTNG